VKTIYIATKKSGAQGYFLQMFDNQPFPHQSEQTPAAPTAKPSTILDLTPMGIRLVYFVDAVSLSPSRSAREKIGLWLFDLLLDELCRHTYKLRVPTGFFVTARKPG
jgi:hypothetical protein